MASPPLFHRILVALDGSAESRVLLDYAARLARRLRAELHGLFVEDVNLIRLAELSCSRVVSYTGTTSVVNVEEISREMRLQSEGLRREFARVSATYALQSSFRTSRGRVAEELLSASLDTDIVVIGRGEGAIRRRSHVGATVRRVATEAPSAVLIPGRRLSDGPIAVAYDSTPPAERALAAAADLADTAGAVAFKVTDGEPTGSWTPPIEKAFAARKLPVRILEVARADLAAAVNRARPSLFVYGCDCAPQLNEPLQEMFSAIDAPILLIRGSPIIS